MLKLIVFTALAHLLLSCSAVNSPSIENPTTVTNVVSGDLRTVGNSEPSEVKLTFSAEKREWKPNEPFMVKFSFENLSDDAVKLYSVVGLMFARIGKKGKDIELSSGFSLTKEYDEKAVGCQNDLTPDRYNEKGAIIASKQTVLLEKGVKKEFSFDLNKTCWKETKSSVWANRELSSLVKSGKYELYLESSFVKGKMTELPAGYDRNTVKSLQTDKLEIEIK
jgi:hypothetical protein